MVDIPEKQLTAEELRAETPAPATPELPKPAKVEKVAAPTAPEPKVAPQPAKKETAPTKPAEVRAKTPVRKETPPRQVQTPYGKKVTPAPQKPEKKPTEPPKPAKKAAKPKVEPKKQAPSPKQRRQQPTRTSDELPKVDSPNSKGSAKNRKGGSKVFPLPSGDPKAEAPVSGKQQMTAKVIPQAVEEVKVIKKTKPEDENAFEKVTWGQAENKETGKPYEVIPKPLAKPFMDLYKMPSKFEKRMNKHYNPAAQQKKSYNSAKRLYDMANTSKMEGSENKSIMTSPAKDVIRKLPTYYKDHLTNAIEKEQLKLDRFKQTSGPTVQEEMKDVRKEMLSKHANLIGKLDSINDTLKKLLK